jgi:transposase
MARASEVFIGIDVGKSSLDVADLSTGEVFSYDNQPSGIQALIKPLAELKPVLVVCEASGGYELDLVIAAQEEGLPIVVANPRQVRAFAKASGRLAKTDRLDALMIARYAYALRPEVRPLPDALARSLEALVARRRQIVDLLTMEKQRLGMAKSPRIRDNLQQVITFLEQQRRGLEKEIHSLILKHQPWATKRALIITVKGIADNIAAVILADLPELGTLNPKQISALVGLAPFNFDSGQMKGSRHIFGGRSSVRCALYQAARVAAKHNPYIKSLYQRLIAKGKPTQVALIACARHLLVMLNAMIRDNLPWNPPPIPIPS